MEHNIYKTYPVASINGLSRGAEGGGWKIAQFISVRVTLDEPTDRARKVIEYSLAFIFSLWQQLQDSSYICFDFSY